MVQKSRKVWPKLDYLQQCKTHSERCKVENMMLTCCQDHILAENIWFVWSSGDVTDAGQQTTNIEDRATQPMDDIDGGWVSQQARKPQSFTSWKLQGWGSTRIEVKCYLVKLELRWAETPLLIRHFQQFQHSKTLSTLLIFSRDCWYIWWEQSWGLDKNTNW